MNRIAIKVLGLLGSILGIASCGCTCVSCPMYGTPPPPPTPTAEYKLSGTVVDAKSGNPLQGISLGFQSGYWGTATSAADGTWSMDVNGSYFSNETYTLDATDVDGATNGSYDKTTTALTLTKTAAGSDAKHAGVFEQNQILVSLYPIEFKLSGKVVDYSTGNPVPGILLTYQSGTTTSAADGTWSLDVIGAVINLDDLSVGVTNVGFDIQWPSITSDKGVYDAKGILIRVYQS